MEHRVLCVGELQTDCYLIWSDPARAIVLDPGDEAEHILRQIRDNGLTVQAVVLTHAHADHMLAAEAVCAATGAPVPEGRLIAFGSTLFLAPREFPELKGLRVLRAGLELGEVLKNRFEPAHAWALWMKAPERGVSFPAASDELRRYLAGETLQDTRRGWMPVCVDGYSLGWAKGDGTILKNHYPKALRRPL